MSEAPAKRKNDTSLTSSNKWVTPVLLVLLVAIFVVSMVMGARHTDDGEEGFAGTDDAAAEAAEEAGAKSWIEPIFEPNSGEVESGLFALQAALGAGVAGYALGRMSGLKKGRKEAEVASDLDSTAQVEQATVSADVADGATTARS